MHNFTVESQVQYHAPLAFRPRTIERDGKIGHGLTPGDLTIFVNSAEWTLCMYPPPHLIHPGLTRRQLQVSPMTQSYTSFSSSLPQKTARCTFSIIMGKLLYRMLSYCRSGAPSSSSIRPRSISAHLVSTRLSRYSSASYSRCSAFLLFPQASISPVQGRFQIGNSMR